jgi:hypothetical protein
VRITAAAPATIAAQKTALDCDVFNWKTTVHNVVSQLRYRHTVKRWFLGGLLLLEQAVHLLRGAVRRDRRVLFIVLARDALFFCPANWVHYWPTVRLAGSAQATSPSSATKRTPSPCVCFILPPRRWCGW